MIDVKFSAESIPGVTISIYTSKFSFFCSFSILKEEKFLTEETNLTRETFSMGEAMTVAALIKRSEGESRATL